MVSVASKTEQTPLEFFSSLNFSQLPKDEADYISTLSDYLDLSKGIDFEGFDKELSRQELLDNIWEWWVKFGWVESSFEKQFKSL